MDEYKSNSDKSKEKEQALPDPVVKAHIVENKKSSVFDGFFTSDIRSIGSSIAKDVIVPGAKRSLHDALVGIADMMLYGKDHIDSYNYSRPKRQFIDYSARYNNPYYDDRDCERPRTMTPSVDNIVFDSYGEAEDCRHSIFSWIDRYGKISVRQVYSLAGVSVNSDHTKEYFGWVNLDDRNCRICPCDGGYYLSMPRAVPFD